MEMFTEAFLVDDCQLQWQNYHEPRLRLFSGMIYVESLSFYYVFFSCVSSALLPGALSTTDEEIIYKSAKQENAGLIGDLEMFRRQAKDALWYATMKRLGRDSEALCSYENTCVETVWYEAQKCHVTDYMSIDVEQPKGEKESKARCNALSPGFMSKFLVNLQFGAAPRPHCRFIVCDDDDAGGRTCKLYSCLNCKFEKVLNDLADMRTHQKTLRLQANSRHVGERSKRPLFCRK
ncbi:unnamed protein product [Symbiodinium sp. CCMP2592]|nr:unnamed protein product [Symbiodinium sp. CCMP2592]